MAETEDGKSGTPSRRVLLSGAACAGLVTLAGCGRKEKTAEPPPQPNGPAQGSLQWAIEGPWRPVADRARDAFRHPAETLRFFGLQPRMTVVEFWPGSGWYTEIVAPYLAEGQGKYVAAGFQTGPGTDPAQTQLMANFQQRFGTDRKLYGEIEFSAFGPTSGPVTEAGTADLVMFMRNIHAWMAAGIAEKAFADAWAALRPGGILGVEQHRLAPDEDQDPAAANGYVQEAFVRQLAAEAGFAFVAASEINANAEDTKDHPFGVDTLPPMRLTAPRGEPANPSFDRSAYDAIGESDRMTLKFRKPE
ncbi:class I SAM-dependent methyltransferase [Brevundimonas sp. NPDC092305]|uniref:class I SAM-dependent methyltransferase n=1 Tax=Brevundimonas sp. NPDC092305 TaxID=3363957 RepID=UPI00380CC059